MSKIAEDNWKHPLYEQAEIERVADQMTQVNAVFVFGSNQAGRHGAGAAYVAKKQYGAILGKGVGHHGKSYALPTKDFEVETLPISRIEQYVDEFRAYAAANPSLIFLVTRIGCGLAGLTDEQIAPMFKGAPDNCYLPIGWREYNGEAE